MIPVDGTVDLCKGTFRRFCDVAKVAYPSHIAATLRSTWNRWKTDDIILAAKATPRRKRKVSDELAKQAADTFCAGYTLKTHWVPYSDYKEVS